MREQTGSSRRQRLGRDIHCKTGDTEVVRSVLRKVGVKRENSTEGKSCCLVYTNIGREE